jgi:hypothetical protein
MFEVSVLGAYARGPSRAELVRSWLGAASGQFPGVSGFVQTGRIGGNALIKIEKAAETTGLWPAFHA